MYKKKIIIILWLILSIIVLDYLFTILLVILISIGVFVQKHSKNRAYNGKASY